LTPFAEARRLVLERVAPLGTEVISLDGLSGRVFAQDLVCPFDVPHFDNSQVDGYAVRAADTGPRHVVGVSAAGGATSPSVDSGEAVRIFTGAPLPTGADAVVMQEDARREGAVVWLEENPKAGDLVRRRGEEIAAGAFFEVRGRVATPPFIGLAASFGFAAIEVVRHPRVTVVATGSELVPPGSSLGKGQVYASNPAAIAAAIRGMGLASVETRLVGDQPNDTDAVLDRALESSDVVITVGGVSVGEHDLVRPTLARLGTEELLWRVAIKPGKPFYFGRHGDKPVFGLPGNPVSALVTFVLFVRPALRRMLGHPEPEEETVARLGTAIQRTDLRYEFLRATLADGVARPVEAQGSHMQTGLAFANALIHVPEKIASLRAGEKVNVTALGWDG